MSDREKLLSTSEDDEYTKAALAPPVKPSLPTATPILVFVFVSIAAFANLMFGYENSVVASGVTDYYAPCVGVTDKATVDFRSSFLKGALALGATLVCPFAGFLQDGLGRRVTLILCCVAYMCACAVTASSPGCVSPGGFPQMATGRVLTGMVIGIFSSTVPMYIAELSPPAVRGGLVTVNQVCICTGILLGYVASTVLKGRWVAQFLSALPLAVISLGAFVAVMPYSPRWLMSKGREEEAEGVLVRIYGRGSPVVAGEMEAIRRVIAEQGGAAGAAGTSRFALLLQPHILWSVAIGVMGSIMQQWVGVNAVNAFAPSIFESAGSSPDEAHIQTIYIGVAKLVFVVVALYLMDKVGRKPLLVVGCIGMAATSALLAASYSLENADTRGNTAVAALVLYMAFFEISLGPILWLLLSELYPVQIKGVAMSIGSTMCWLMTYAVNQSYQPLSNAFSALGGNTLKSTGYVFYFFAAVSAASAVWIQIYLFETKGRTLEEIQGLLKGEKVVKEEEEEEEGGGEGMRGNVELACTDS